MCLRLDAGKKLFGKLRDLAVFFAIVVAFTAAADLLEYISQNKLYDIGNAGEGRGFRYRSPGSRRRSRCDDAARGRCVFLFGSRTGCRFCRDVFICF